jgi:hypothetical protein
VTRRRPLRPWFALAGAALVFTVIAVWRYRPAAPLIRGMAQAQSVELLTSAGTQSPIYLERAVLAGDDSLILADIHVKLETGVLLRARRAAPDTLILAIAARRRGASIGCVMRTTGNCLRRLSDAETFAVLLRPSGMGAGRFLFPFRAVRVLAGDPVTQQGGGVTPLLLSGDFSIQESTVFGDTFTAASESLGLGEAVQATLPDTAGPRQGYGLLTVSDEPGITVTFNMPAGKAEIFRGDTVPGAVSTPGFSRYRHDRFAQWLFIVLSYLVIQPLVEFIREWTAKRFLPGRSRP